MAGASASVEVEGGEQFKRTMGQLADGLENLTPAHDKAGQRLLDEADPRTPRLSGQLASTGRSTGAADEATVSFDEEYAGYVHNGTEHQDAQPWLADTAAESSTTLTDVYVDHVADLVDNVKGT